MCCNLASVFEKKLASLLFSEPQKCVAHLNSSFDNQCDRRGVPHFSEHSHPGEAMRLLVGTKSCVTFVTAMHKTTHCISLLLLAFLAHSIQAQSAFFRFKADFSIKEKETEKEQGRLITGTVFFDKNLDKTVYNIRFPEPEQWLVQDTFLYRMQADTLVSQRIVPPVGEFSIFNMILSQQLNDFGLAKVGYTPSDLQQVEDQVIAQWLPPEQLKDYLGPVTISQKNKRLHATAFYDRAENLVSKFYFQDYSVHEGLPVPGKVYQIFYRTEGEFVRLMTLKNIQINQLDEDHIYDFTVPAGQ